MTALAPRFISAEEVRSVLTWPLLNEAVEQALKAAVLTSRSDSNEPFAYQPARSLTICENNGVVFTMPGYVGNYQLGDKKHNTLSCKLVSSFKGNEQRKPPLPNILANIVLFNAETGQLQCVMDGTQITAWRTAAASLVATKYLYLKRFADAMTRSIKVAIVGCGVQGQSHALGICKTFNVSEIYLWNRTTSKAQHLAEQLRVQAPNTLVQVSSSAAEAVAEADVICIATFAAQSLIELKMLKKSSVHINAVGAGQVHFGEVAQDIYEQAKVYVDNWTGAKVELKDLKADIVAEVGEVIKNAQYPAEQGITIFQSLGMAAEDATVAQAVQQALQTNVRVAAKI